VSTRLLFRALLSRMKIDVIGDVGSMDGTEALAFRKAAPGSSIYAFEPNPRNLAAMQARGSCRDRGIEIVAAAATNQDGEAEFFLIGVGTELSQQGLRRGMSSLYRRTAWPPEDIVRVRTLRLDTFLSARCAPGARVALWIDAEGKAYEAVEGATGVADRIDLLHVEVETIPCIGSDQRLYPDVRALLERMDFIELATDQARSAPQFNALYVRATVARRLKGQIAWCLMRARIRRLIARLAFRLCPGCVRRYRRLA
jgi:FkbM family methyltransferase